MQTNPKIPAHGRRSVATGNRRAERRPISILQVRQRTSYTRRDAARSTPAWNHSARFADTRTIVFLRGRVSSSSLVLEECQERTHLLQSSMEMSFYGALRATEDAADLVGRKPVEVTKDHDCSLQRGEFVQRALNV